MPDLVNRYWIQVNFVVWLIQLTSHKPQSSANVRTMHQPEFDWKEILSNETVFLLQWKCSALFLIPYDATYDASRWNHLQLCWFMEAFWKGILFTSLTNSWSLITADRWKLFFPWFRPDDSTEGLFQENESIFLWKLRFQREFFKRKSTFSAKDDWIKRSLWEISTKRVKIKEELKYWKMRKNDVPAVETRFEAETKKNYSDNDY